MPLWTKHFVAGSVHLTAAALLVLFAGIRSPSLSSYGDAFWLDGSKWALTPRKWKYRCTPVDCAVGGARRRRRNVLPAVVTEPPVYSHAAVIRDGSVAVLHRIDGGYDLWQAGMAAPQYGHSQTPEALLSMGDSSMMSLRRDSTGTTKAVDMFTRPEAVVGSDNACNLAAVGITPRQLAAIYKQAPAITGMIIGVPGRELYRAGDLRKQFNALSLGKAMAGAAIIKAATPENLQVLKTTDNVTLQDVLALVSNYNFTQLGYTCSTPLPEKLPGFQFRYLQSIRFSEGQYNLAVCLANQVANVSAAEMIRTYLAEPCNMSDTKLNGTLVGGGLMTSLQDMARFASCWMGSDYLADVRDAMIVNHYPDMNYNEDEYKQLDTDDALKNDGWEYRVAIWQYDKVYYTAAFGNVLQMSLDKDLYVAVTSDGKSWPVSKGPRAFNNDVTLNLGNTCSNQCTTLTTCPTFPAFTDDVFVDCNDQNLACFYDAQQYPVQMRQTDRIVAYRCDAAACRVAIADKDSGVYTASTTGWELVQSLDPPPRSVAASTIDVFARWGSLATTEDTAYFTVRASQLVNDAGTCALTYSTPPVYTHTLTCETSTVVVEFRRATDDLRLASIKIFSSLGEATIQYNPALTLVETANAAPASTTAAAVSDQQVVALARIYSTDFGLEVTKRAVVQYDQFQITTGSLVDAKPLSSLYIPADFGEAQIGLISLDVVGYMSLDY